MLNGIRVIDFTNYLPGPFASLRLAELGAEIIKIEPLEGDPARNLGFQKNGTGIVFLANNRLKKSVTLNLKNNEGRDIALGLISKADVVLESFRPGVMERLGLGYETVKEMNPGIVYCSISGYGQSGLLSEKGSHDLNYMALSGILSQLKDETGKPVHPSITFADFLGGFAAVERILAGLVCKLKTGEGSYHSISITDVMASMMGNHVLMHQQFGNETGITPLNGSIVSYAIYETQDRRYVALAALEEKFWRNFCIAVGREDWIAGHFSKTEETNPIFQEVTELFKSRTFEEWIQFSQEIDCCLAPVLETGEISQFPYFKEKEIVFRSTWGDDQVKMHGDTDHTASTAPPEKGQHTFEILKDLLHASKQQIKNWKEQGVI
jgi:alpha-methylacyl-CoA racemase